MKEELEYALNGHGRVEFAGDGTMRARIAKQTPLFEGAEPPSPTPILEEENLLPEME